jgi:hypothetical protein
MGKQQSEKETGKEEGKAYEHLDPIETASPEFG